MSGSGAFLEDQRLRSEAILRERDEALELAARQTRKLVALTNELEAARAALGPAWFAGGASLAEAVKRKCTALEQLATTETRPVGEVLRVNAGLEAGDGEQEVLVQGADWASLVQLAHAAGGEGEA